MSHEKKLTKRKQTYRNGFLRFKKLSHPLPHTHSAFICSAYTYRIHSYIVEPCRRKNTNGKKLLSEIKLEYFQLIPIFSHHVHVDYVVVVIWNSKNIKFECNYFSFVYFLCFEVFDDLTFFSDKEKSLSSELLFRHWFFDAFFLSRKF